MLAKHRYLAQLYRGSYRRDRVDLFLDDLDASFGRLASLLRDSSCCLFVPVMLAEQLSIVQTRQLIAKLAPLRLPITDIVVNRLYPLNPACPACRAARSQQHGYVRRLSEEFREFRLWEVPLQGAEVQGADQLRSFWNGLRPLREDASEAQAAPRLPLCVKHPAALPDAEACLLLFAGKGGVGKTTLACATALRLAEAYPGKEVLLFSTDPAHCLSACLDRPVGPEEMRVCPGLTAVEIDSEAAFDRIKRQYAAEIAALCDGLTADTTVDLEFDREVFERLMDLSPPGVDEVMALTRVVQLLEAKKYDFFVVDTAPSGHLIRFLELPSLVRDWLKVLFALFLKYKNVFRLPQLTDFLVSLSKGIKALQSLLVDRSKGQLWLVSTPAELSLDKTRALLTACRRAGIHVPALFLNLVTPDGPCPLCHVLAESEARMCARFETAFAGIHQGLVYRCGELLGREWLAELGRALYFIPIPNDEREPCLQAATTSMSPS
jgi:arsenite-transporting ATPase